MDPVDADRSLRDVKAGEVVLICEPWVSSVHWDQRSVVCAGCWKKTGSLRICGACRYCCYCGRSCQKSHWQSEHRFECTLLKIATEYLEPRASGEIPDPGNKWPVYAQLLFVKALNKYSQYSMEPRDDLLKEAFAKPMRNHRLDKTVEDIKPGPLLKFRDYVSSRLERKIAGVLSDRECSTLAHNVLLCCELITEGLRNMGDRLGYGVYLESAQFRSACRGNSEWLHKGNKMVVKALTDTPQFQGAQQITVTPIVFRSQPYIRAERIFIDKAFSGPIAPTWSCKCADCTDAGEAELNPMKCITKSCMEPIPTDHRAREPCLQCGVINESRLGLAKSQLKEVTLRLLEICDPLNIIGILRHFRLLEIYQELKTNSDSILHPGSVLKASIGLRVAQGMQEQDQVAQAWQTWQSCREAVDKFYCRPAKIDPHYGLLLEAWGRNGAKFYSNGARKSAQSGDHGMQKAMLQKMKDCQEIQKEGQAIYDEFCKF